MIYVCSYIAYGFWDPFRIGEVSELNMQLFYFECEHALFLELIIRL